MLYLFFSRLPDFNRMMEKQHQLRIDPTLGLNVDDLIREFEERRRTAETPQTPLGTTWGATFVGLAAAPGEQSSLFTVAALASATPNPKLSAPGVGPGETVKGLDRRPTP
jgi:hypothetical protein